MLCNPFWFKLCKIVLQTQKLEQLENFSKKNKKYKVLPLNFCVKPDKTIRVKTLQNIFFFPISAPRQDRASFPSQWRHSPARCHCPWWCHCKPSLFIEIMLSCCKCTSWISNVTQHLSSRNAAIMDMICQIVAQESCDETVHDLETIKATVKLNKPIKQTK